MIIRNCSRIRRPYSRGRGGARGGLVAVAAGLVAGELGVPEGGEPVQGVGDGAGGPGQDPADRVGGELGVRVSREMGRDEVAQLPGAGCRAAGAAWLAPAGGGFQQAAGLGGGGADGVHRGQRGGGVAAAEHVGGLGGCGGYLAPQQFGSLTGRRLRLAVRRRRGGGVPGGGGVSAIAIGDARVRRGLVAGCGAVRRGGGGLARGGGVGGGAAGGLGVWRAAVRLAWCRVAAGCGEVPVSCRGGARGGGARRPGWICLAWPGVGGLPGGGGGGAAGAFSGGPGGVAAGFEGGQFPAG